MAILHGKDQLTSKFITAEISDSSNRIHYVPIKHTIGEYFIADLDGQLYAFTLKDARILTHRKTATKSFQVIQYDTSHYSSIKPEIKELEIMLKKNSLPKMDRMMHDVMRVLGRREKSLKSDEDFTPHRIDDLVALFAEKEGEFPEQVKKIQNYLDELDVDEIVTPVQRVTDYIQNDLIATSPSFLGSLLQQYHRVFGEIGRITNSPIKPTTSYMKIIMIVLLIGVGIAGVYIAYDAGAFEGVEDFTDNITTIQEGFKGLPSPTQGIQTGPTGGVDYSDQSLQQRYSDCNALKADINAGTIDYNKMSDTMKGFIDDCPAPDA